MPIAAGTLERIDTKRITDELARLFDAHENGILSPVGLITCLLLAHVGSSGSTAQTLTALLGCSSSDAAAAYAAIESDLEGSDVHHAGACWLRPPLTPNPTWRAALPTVEVGGLKTRTELDAWVSERTGGLIREFPSSVDDAALVLATVLALVATWEQELFKPSDTVPAAFHSGRGDVQVPMMFTTKPARAQQHGDVTSVDLALTGGLVVRLGIGEATAPPPSVISAVLGAGPPLASPDTPIHVHVPRLALLSKYDSALTELCRTNLGLEPLFAPGAMSHMTERRDPLNLYKVAQAATLSMDEHGVKAAAVTGGMVLMSMALRPKEPIVIRFDRPFAIALLSGGLPLFVGWVARP